MHLFSSFMKIPDQLNNLDVNRIVIKFDETEIQLGGST